MSEVSAGIQDVVDFLIADHDRILHLLAQIEGPADAARRRDLTTAVIAEVMRHSAAEGRVYAMIEKHLPENACEVPEGAREVERDQRERSIVVAMDRMQTLDAGDPEFFEWLSHLQHLFLDHAHDQEDEDFPSWRASVPAAELVALRTSVAAQLEPNGALPRRVSQDPVTPAIASPTEGTLPTKVPA